MKIIEWKSGEFEVTTDRDRLEIQTIHDFLALKSEWARGIAREIVERSIEHSLCFGVFHRNRRVGFAGVITDCATIACLGDVFVLRLSRTRAGEVVDGVRGRASCPSRSSALDFDHDIIAPKGRRSPAAERETSRGVSPFTLTPPRVADTKCARRLRSPSLGADHLSRHHASVAALPTNTGFVR
jgi:hypothetical protein